MGVYAANTTLAALNAAWPNPIVGGKLYAWGLGSSGQYGINNVAGGRSSPVQVDSNDTGKFVDPLTFISFACGYSSSLGIKSDGTLWGWGTNSSGQLGDNTVISKSSPIQVNTSTNWSKIFAKWTHFAAIKTDGTLWMWGVNINGQLGKIDVIYRSSPTQVGVATNWSQVSIGANHTIAVKTDGTLWGWGKNLNGQLGKTDVLYRSSPTQIGTDTNWYQTSCPVDATVAIKTDGTIWAWGKNNNGALAQNDVIYRSSPIQIGTLTNWSKTESGYHTVALKTDGTLWGWGANTRGPLGQGDGVSRSSPVQLGALTNWTDVRAGQETTFSIKNGALWGCGTNNNGTLGFNNLVSYTTLTQMQPNYNWLEVAAGRYHVIAKRSDGSAWAIGTRNTFNLGAGGTNDLVERSSPVQIAAPPIWSKIATSGTHTLGIKSDGTLWGWGVNTGGQLGINTALSVSSPVQVGALTNWSQVSCGTVYTLALKNDGSMWSWGTNGSGNLGDLTGTISKSSPIQIGIGGYWTNIAAMNASAAAIKSDGTLWTWGNGNQGQLGNSIIAAAGYRSSPMQVGADNNWVGIWASYLTVWALKSNGSLYAWGANGSGQYGNLSLATASSPIQIGAAFNWLTSISSISFGGLNAAYVKTDGTLWTWGANAAGQLGNGVAANLRSSPVQVGALTNWSKVFVNQNDPSSGRSMFATKTDGSLWGWGDGGSGRLGDSSIVSKSSPVQIGAAGENWTKIVHAGVVYGMRAL
jgi:alpha-tubulin suppressor-like RCC1 family protein